MALSLELGCGDHSMAFCAYPMYRCDLWQVRQSVLPQNVFRNVQENALTTGANPVRIVVRCRPVCWRLLHFPSAVPIVLHAIVGLRPLTEGVAIHGRSRMPTPS